VHAIIFVFQINSKEVFVNMENYSQILASSWLAAPHNRIEGKWEVIVKINMFYTTKIQVSI